MGWTDERASSLTKLWLDGLSASEIAKQLGGVSRNAVIGKVHRLGLSGRTSPSQPTRPAFKAPRPARSAGQTMPSAPRRVTPAKAPSASVPVAAAPAPLPAFRHEEPGSATVLTVGAHMCKWPIGDPSSDGFTFCGRRSSEGPYCVDHTRVAYQPKPSRKKSPALDLARSLRRYF